MNFNPTTWSRRNQIIGGVVASVLVIGALAPSPDDDSPTATESVVTDTVVTTVVPTTTTPPVTAPPVTAPPAPAPTTTAEPQLIAHPSVIWMVSAVTGPVWAEIQYNLDELIVALDNEDSAAVSATSYRISDGFYDLFYDAPIGNDEIGVLIEDTMLDCAIAYEVLGEGWATLDVGFIEYGLELQEGCTTGGFEIAALLEQITASF